MSVSGIVEALARASLQGGLFVAGVWIVCRLFPRLPASVRCGLWWAACLKLLLGLAALPALDLPLLPAAEAMAPAPVSIRSVAPAQALTPGPAPDASRPPSLKDLGFPALGALWLLGILALSAKDVRQLARTRRIVQGAEPVREGWVRKVFSEICERLALRREPGLRGSGDVRTPQVTGLIEPVVLVPRSGLERLSPQEVSMTLCHELVHLRRRDLWLGWVPALAGRIFFFHPLAALAAREYAIAREAACDAEVIRVLGTAPQAYGRLLLRWGVAPRETGLAAAGASPSLQNLKRRLQMLQHTSHDKRRSAALWWLAGAAVLAGLVPLRITAQEPAPEAPEAVAAPEAPAAPEAAPAPEVAPALEGESAPEPPEAATPEAIEDGVQEGVPASIEDGVRGGVPGALYAPRAGRPATLPTPAAPPRVGRPAVLPTPAAAPRALPVLAGTPVLPAMAPRARPVASPMPVPAVAPVAATPRVAAARGVPPPPPPPPVPPVPPAPPKHSGYRYSTGDNGDSWVLLSGRNDTVMSGSTHDLEQVKRLRGDSDEPILWFRQGGKAYVVRDAATLEQIEKVWQPVNELGARQGELGGRQGKLGGQQGALGAKQGALGAKQGALAAEQARQGDRADDRDFERRHEELSEQMEALGRQQEELGRQQEALGRQQEELGRQQEAASAKAEARMKDLLNQAIRSGQAKEVR